MSKLLLLGASGFTGRYLKERLLKRDLQLICPSRGELPLFSRASEIRDYLQEHRPDTICNLAGLSHVEQSNPDEIYRVNALFVADLLEAAVQTPSVRRIVLAGTANIYGNTKGAVKETDFAGIRPQNHYGASKFLMEQFTHWHRDPLEICVTRPFSCIGIGQKPTFLLPKLVQSFKRKDPTVRLGNTDVRRDFVDIRDVAAIYESLLTSDRPLPPTVNIASNKTHSIGEILEELTRISGHTIRIEQDPGLVRKNDLFFQQGDDTLLKESVAYRPRFDFRSTLQWMYSETQGADS